MGVQIDGKRVANFAHLSDWNGHACVEVEQALPAGEISHVSDALEVLEKPVIARSLTLMEKSPSRLWRG
eukprot:6203451-Pleurochrysis_carterae.AAC.1